MNSTNAFKKCINSVHTYNPFLKEDFPKKFKKFIVTVQSDIKKNPCKMYIPHLKQQDHNISELPELKKSNK